MSSAQRSIKRSVSKPVNTSGKKAGRQLEVDALKHEIQKLRWMGMDEEAETACARLSRIAPGAVPDTARPD